jgi:hypothetical protein
MSEKLQRAARDRRDAAEEREDNARRRETGTRERGDEMNARRHRHSAERQAAGARAAERLRRADAAVEGDQLGEDSAADPAAEHVEPLG